jgi:uncharacterized protein
VSATGVELHSADGLRLEGAWDVPTTARGAVVLCHPHPKLGGTMNAPLLLALRDELVARGWATLRFNFRGIGRSEGTPSTGVDEVDDARAAIGFMRARLGSDPIALVGWSFGAAVAIRAAGQDDSLLGCVAIAPAVVAKADITAGLPPAHELDLGVPLLFVCGTNDRVVDPQDCRSWIARVPHGELVEIAAANHFFWGRYDELGVIVGDWLDDHRNS